jgi:hypothetical protein
MDVARKVMILARECGLQLDMSSLSVSSLVPEPLASGCVQEYIDRLPEVRLYKTYCCSLQSYSAPCGSGCTTSSHQGSSTPWQASGDWALFLLLPQCMLLSNLGHPLEPLGHMPLLGQQTFSAHFSVVDPCCALILAAAVPCSLMGRLPPRRMQRMRQGKSSGK